MNKIYLDSSAHYPVCKDVIRELKYFDYASLANPQSTHTNGVNCSAIVERARDTIALCLNCKPSEIYFTSGASESAKIIVDTVKKYYGEAMLTCSPYEHDCIKKLCTIGGQYTEKNVQMLVSNITGQIFDTSHALVCDITSAIGNIDVDLEKKPYGYAFGSAEKFGGLSGSGFIYANSRYPKPLMYNKTENVLGIHMMAIAMFHATELENIQKKYKHCFELVECLGNKLNFHNVDFIINNPDYSIESILNLSFKDVDGEALKNYLDAYNICVSTGSACNSGNNEPDPTLVEMGVPDRYINGTIRFSFSEYNTMEEVDYVVEKIAQFIKMNGVKNEA